MAIRLCTWLWRGLIALVFLQAAWSKWSQGIEDVHLMALYHRTPIYDRIVAGSAVRHYTILSAEVLVSLWMLSGLKPRWAAVYTAMMLTAFIVLLGVEIRSSDPQACNCGLRQLFPGGDPRVELAVGIVRNIVLLLGCGWIWLMSDETKPTAAAPPPPAPAS